MWPLKTILFVALYSCGCAAALLNPIWGVVTYLAVYQTDPTETWWGMPLAQMGIRFSLFAAIFTLAGFLTGRRHSPHLASFNWWEAGVIVILALAVMSTVTGVGYGPTARHEFEKFWKVLVFALVLGRVAASRWNLKVVLWTLVAGCAYIGHDALNAPADAFVLGRLESIGGPDFSTTSGAAAHLTAMLPLVGVAFLISKSWRWRIAAAIAGGLTVNAIIMCRTRSAFIGLISGLLVAFLAAPRVRRFRIHALLVGGLIVGFALTDEHFWTRMSTISDRRSWETDLATVSRTEIWVASVRIFADHPFGIGVGNFTQVIGDYDPRHHRRSTHNSLVVCFVELGIQGGLLFFGLVLGSLYMLYRVVRMADWTLAPLETRLLAYGFLVSLISYLVTAMGTQRFYCESFWWVLVFPLALHRTVLREIQSARLEQLPEIEETAASTPLGVCAASPPSPRYAF